MKDPIKSKKVAELIKSATSDMGMRGSTLFYRSDLNHRFDSERIEVLYSALMAAQEYIKELEATMLTAGAVTDLNSMVHIPPEMPPQEAYPAAVHPDPQNFSNAVARFKSNNQEFCVSGPIKLNAVSYLGGVTEFDYPIPLAPGRYKFVVADGKVVGIESIDSGVVRDVFGNRVDPDTKAG